MLATSVAAACTSLVLLFNTPVAAQVAPAADNAAVTISDRVTINGTEAIGWTEGRSRVVLVRGGVSIVTENVTLTAQQAVIWITPLDNGNFGVEVALIGDATAQQKDSTRQGPELLVRLASRPDIQLVAGALTEREARGEATYLQGLALRQAQPVAPAVSNVQPPSNLPAVTPGSSPVAGDPTRAPAPVLPLTPEAKRDLAGPVNFQAGTVSTETGPDGKVIIILTDNVFLLQRRNGGDLIELRADRGVVFTNITDLNKVIQGEDRVRLEESVAAVYLEGDVRVNFTPAIAADGKQRGEQRLRAKRATYDFESDKAILTDAVLQTEDPSRGIPFVVRAREIRRVSQDKYSAEDASLSTSTFAQPTLSLSARKLQVIQTEATGTGVGRTAPRTSFVASGVAPEAFGIPFFYLPRVWGSTTDRGSPLRNFQFSSERGFGAGVETQFGLFETIGRAPPKGFDAAYRLDYFGSRGPAFGLDASYSGSQIDLATGQPTSYSGDFTSYYAFDSGEDRFSRDRSRFERDNEVRGRTRFRHQQFLTDAWQLQLQAAHVSDIGFLPEYFESQFNNQLQQETSFYIKRTQGSEAFFLYANVDLIGVPTSADQLQEGSVRFTSVGRDFFNYTTQRLPEVGYSVAGQSFLDDQLTFSSANTLSGLVLNESRGGLVEDLGFQDVSRNSRDESFPGIPSAGYTGVSEGDYIGRADLRQEIAWPTMLGEVRVTPFIVGRYTGYTDSPGGDSQNRFLAGAGVRASTTIWKIDDSVRSSLFDLTRLRHIITPEATAFVAAQSVDRNDVFIIDETTDSVNDISAINLVLRQTWQTKRGQIGRQRSVDFLTLNVGYTFFGNEPDEISTTNSRGEFISPRSFRGLFFESMPESSVPRSNIYADSIWRATDSTAVLSDISFNTDAGSLATGSVGVAVEREPRVSYYAGIRYIGDINSTILSFSVDYEISRKYSAQFNQSFDLAEGGSRDTSVAVYRKFEQFVGFVSFFFDQIEGTSGVRVGLSPGGVRPGTTPIDLRR